LSPADRVVVGWRITEYELQTAVDNEASHTDKPVVLTICDGYPVNLWLELIRNIDCPSTFHNKLKTHIFTAAYT